MNKWRDPVSAMTHLVGAVLTIPIGLFLILQQYHTGDVVNVLAMIVFVLSMLLLYSASTTYHIVNLSKEKIYIFKRIDHMMIFVYIAGTYTPICLGPLRGFWGYLVLVIVWSIALIGIFIKIFWLNAPRWLSTSLYVLMGWVALIALVPIYRAIPMTGIVLLVLGGVAYTVGALIYALKKPDFNLKYFGFHEIFHCFVLLGTFFHVIFMGLYI